MDVFVAGAVVSALAALVLHDRGDDIMGDLYVMLAVAFFSGGLLMTL